MVDEIIERALERIKVMPNGCHLWQGRGSPPTIKVGDRPQLVRRVFYADKHGLLLAEAPKLKPKCLDQKCCNPDHMVPVGEVTKKPSQWLHEVQFSLRLDKELAKRIPPSRYPTPHQFKTIWRIETTQDEIKRRLDEVPGDVKEAPDSYEEWASWYQRFIDEGWFDGPNSVFEILEMVGDRTAFTTFPQEFVDRFWQEHKPKAA